MKWKKLKMTALTMALVITSSLTAFAANDKTSSSGHTEEVEQQDPTCVDVGFKSGVYDYETHLYLSGHEEIPAIGHIDGDGDGVCDDCDEEFSVHKAKKVTCTSDGYTGDTESGDRVIMGEIIPATGHKDANYDYICDVCGASINKEKITVTLHYYILNEDYEENKAALKAQGAKVADSAEIPSCKYIVQKVEATQGVEFALPDFPAMNKYVFTWIDTKGNIYSHYISNRDVDLYMAFVESGRDDKTGQCGDNAYWRWFPEEKILYFYGSGPLWTDYDRISDLPWGIYLSEAEKTVMYPGVSARIWMVAKS